MGNTPFEILQGILTSSSFATLEWQNFSVLILMCALTISQLFNTRSPWAPLRGLLLVAWLFIGAASRLWVSLNN
jgi:hypothetical protein